MEARTLVEQHADPPGGTQADARTRIHGMWTAVAGSWGENAEYIEARAATVTARMIALADPQPGDRVLELACGAGGAGLAAAKRVGVSGDVVLSDLVAEMTAIAAERARAAGLRNVRTCVLALEQIDQPDRAYDVVLCREGLMFALDPGRALEEIRRVLRPGGRVALAVWGPRARNPWLSTLFDVASAQLGTPMPPPGVPGPFSLGDPARLGRLLTDAGFVGVTVNEVPAPLRDVSFDAWWARTPALAGPLATRLATLPEDAVRAIQARVREAVRPYETATGLEFPGVSLLAAGRRAEE